MKSILLRVVTGWKIQNLACGLALLLPITPASAQTAKAATAAPAGNVLLAIGEVRAIRNGVAVVLIKGSPIQAGDLVTTGNTSNAQLRMSDGAIIALRAQTEFKIDEYQFNGKADGSEKAVLSLVKGGVRAVTGAIGKQNTDNLKVNAVVATVGIRGTGFNLNYCQGNCVNPDKTLAKDGLYAGVFEGQITVKNEVAQDVLRVNEYLYVGGRSEMPKSLMDPPSFLPDPLAGQKAAKAKGRSSGGEIPNLAVAVEAPVKPADQQVGPPSSPLPVEMGVVVSYPPALVLAPTSWYNTPVQGTTPAVASGSYANYMQRAWVSAQTQIGADGLPLHTTSPYSGVDLLPNSATPSSIAASNILTLASMGSAIQAEIGGAGDYITWGRWASGNVTVTGYNNNQPYAVSSSNGLHYIVGTLANAPPTIASFTLMGATTPTAIANMQGGWFVTGGTLNVNSGSATPITGNLGLYANQSGGSGFYNMTFYSSGGGLAVSGNNLNVSVTRSSGSLNVCTTSCAGTGNVAFYGNNSVSAAGLAYKFDTGSNAVQGVAVFKPQ